MGSINIAIRNDLDGARMLSPAHGPAKDYYKYWNSKYAHSIRRSTFSTAWMNYLSLAWMRMLKLKIPWDVYQPSQQASIRMQFFTMKRMNNKKSSTKEHKIHGV